MKNKLVFFYALFLSVLIIGCTNKTVKEKNSVKELIGNYVTDGYEKRNEGYDWVAVSVTKQSDTTVNIAVRSRADKKKPTCRFDASAFIVGKDTLSAYYEGKPIFFIFRNNKLTISAVNNEDDNLLAYFCSGGASLAGDYIKIKTPLDTTQIDQRTFYTVLTYNDVSFEITAKSNELTIQPSGLSIDNSMVTHNIEGYTVQNAEIADLIPNGYPQVFVYLNTNDKNHYGKAIGYFVNNGKSMSEIHFPDIANDPKINKGYQGHDEFAIVELQLIRRFPIYGVDKKPTDKSRQIQYNLKHGEASPQMVIDQVIEY